MLTVHECVFAQEICCALLLTSQLLLVIASVSYETYSTVQKNEHARDC